LFEPGQAGGLRNALMAHLSQPLAVLSVLAFGAMVLTQRAAHAENEPAFYFEMVHIPGSNDWVATHLVTQKQYQEITGENPSAFENPARPVDTVSWDDAESFCEKLTAREWLAGRLPQDLVYELPTDAQFDAFAAGASLDNAVTSLKTERLGTALSGSLPPSPLGLYDVLGNLWEWCRDWYDNNIRKKDSNKDLPAAYSDAMAAKLGPEQTFKVLRGGAWDTGPADGFTPASRLRYAPGMSNYRTGFRCVVVKASAVAK
jgi:formylglycine-generating enzyme required for sulfatase activity